MTFFGTAPRNAIMLISHYRRLIEEGGVGSGRQYGEPRQKTSLDPQTLERP